MKITSKSELTINPFPRPGSQAGLLLRSNPHELRLQGGLAALQFGVQEGRGSRWHAVRQIAVVALAVGSRLAERAAAADAELVARSRIGGQLDVFRGAQGGATVHRKFWTKLCNWILISLLSKFIWIQPRSAYYKLINGNLLVFALITIRGKLIKLFNKTV